MKRGFLAFFLVAALSILLLGLLPLHTPIPSKTALKTLELEKTQFMAANAKRAAIAYLKHRLPSTAPGLASQDPQESASARAALSSSLAGLENYLERNIGDGYALDTWCGDVPYSGLGTLSQLSVEEGQPKKCGSCLDLGNPLCANYLQANPLRKSAQISGTQPNPLIFSGFAFTLCSQDRSVCTVSYIPQDYEVFF